MPGAVDFIMAATHFFEVHVYSCRSASAEGIEAMKAWLYQRMVDEHRYDGAEVFTLLHWPTQKPPAFVRPGRQGHPVDRHLPEPGRASEIPCLESAGACPRQDHPGYLLGPPVKDYFFALQTWPPAGSFRYPNAGILRADSEDDALVRLREFLKSHSYPEKAEHYRIVPVAAIEGAEGVVALAMAG